MLKRVNVIPGLISKILHFVQKTSVTGNLEKQTRVWWVIPVQTLIQHV